MGWASNGTSYVVYFVESPRFSHQSWKRETDRETERQTQRGRERIETEIGEDRRKGKWEGRRWEEWRKRGREKNIHTETERDRDRNEKTMCKDIAQIL